MVFIGPAILFAIFAAVVVALFKLPRWQRNPPNRFIAAITRPRGVHRMKGEPWTRAERLRGAVFSAWSAIGLAALAFTADMVVDRTVPDDAISSWGSWVTWLGTVGCFMAAMTSVVHLSRSRAAE